MIYDAEVTFNVDQIVRDYGPTVWAAAQRQVLVTIFTDIAWTLVFVVAVAILIPQTRRFWRYAGRKAEEEGDPMSDWIIGRLAGSAGLALLTGGLVVFALVNLNEAIPYALKPT